MGLFQASVINKYLKTLDKQILKSAFESFKSYFHNSNVQENIKNSKEEQFQEGFLSELFVKILGYTLNPSSNFNLTTEYKNIKDSKKADGVIIINNIVKAVIELKGTNTTDLGKAESQAFAYKNNQPECVYVITSNFEKLRFYIDNAIEHIEFNLFTLTEKEFELLYLCLAYESIEKGVPKKLKEESLSLEDVITKKLYQDYSLFKRELHQNLVVLNPQYDALILFKKSQKLLDRYLFLFFAEDRQLLPPNSVRLILTDWRDLQERDVEIPLYDRFKKYFGYLNTGFKGKRYDVFAYNGGLFKPDEILDSVKVDDELLFKHTLKLSDYDFASEVDVNILGHIFENSLNELDEIKAQLDGTEVDKTKTKRKKDGVFYTPKYITKYIVDNTVGKLCTEKKTELNIIEEDYITDKRRQKKTIQELAEKLTTYRNWLLQLKICDPACGSGAFLNQALDFLITEHRYVDELQAKLFGDALILSDIENSILENNLFGVDLNEESVEIAKLSLWLRTAQPNRKLNDLSNNIKCGNSLIDDPEVAGEKTFNWFLEFPKVFPHYKHKKELNKNDAIRKKIIESGVLNYPDQGDYEYNDEVSEPLYSYKTNSKGFDKYGFDVIIGNPPYVDIKNLNNNDVRYFFSKYKTCENRINLYSIFIEKGFNLLNNNGVISYINPNSMLVNSSYYKLRNLIIDNLSKIVKLPDDVFTEAKVETIIFVLDKNKTSETIDTISYSKDETILEIDEKRTINIIKEIWRKDKALNFNLYATSKELSLINKIENNKIVMLEEIADFTLGITPYDKYKGHSEEIIKDRLFHSKVKENDLYKPLINGENITRYYTDSTIKEFVKYGDWLGAKREERFFTDSRIIIRQIVSGKPARIYASYSDESLYFTQIGFGIITKNKNEFSDKYLLVLLNSMLINFYHKYKYLDIEKELFQKVLIANCRKFPIPTISLSAQQPFIEKADLMLTLNKDLQELSGKFQRSIQREFNIVDLPNKLHNWYLLSYAEFVKELEKKKIKLSLSKKAEWEEYFIQESKKTLELKTQIETTDKEIDFMVYKLYELTKEEIEIVENLTK